MFRAHKRVKLISLVIIVGIILCGYLWIKNDSQSSNDSASQSQTEKVSHSSSSNESKPRTHKKKALSPTPMKNLHLVTKPVNPPEHDVPSEDAPTTKKIINIPKANDDSPVDWSHHKDLLGTENGHVGVGDKATVIGKVYNKGKLVAYQIKHNGQVCYVSIQDFSLM